ncbi:MAG: hypothetical protein WAU23_14560 [Ferruginibacter sp.]
MKKIILLAFAAVSITAQAQVYIDRIGFNLESIADINIGWMTIRNHTTAPKGKQLGDRIYSANQIGYSQKFVEWMQQSYLPKGCLGDATYYQNTIPKFSGTNSLLGNAINMHKHALPHMYGAQSKIYMFLKKDAQGKFIPQNNLSDDWRIEANGLQSISMPVSFISSSEEYYFILADFSGNSKGYNANDVAASGLMGFTNHKNLSAYKHFYIPNNCYVVIMTKDKELPFEKVTIGEFFTQTEKQLPVWQNTEPVSAENFSKAQKNLTRLKEKYKTKWNNIAELKLSGTSITLIDFVNAGEDRNDMFDNKDIYGKEGVQATFPVLKVKKNALALCKTDQPQWLVIRWTMSMPNESYNKYLHESILNNFNFEYVYNFFFDPEKVKGQPYKPLRSPSFKEAVIAIEASEASKKNTTDKNIHFFEDFSTTAIGKKPTSWRTKYGYNGGVVANLDGLNGNWVLITDNTITPDNLKKPLPQNFTLRFDLVAVQNFTWGAKRLHFKLAKETSPGNDESFLDLGFRPGFDGRDGEVSVESKFPSPPGYANIGQGYVAAGFSNNKKNNLIKIAIKKTNEMLQVFIDNIKIAEYDKAIPAAHLFNAMSFYSYNSGEHDKFYISNIKITKD